MIEAIITVVSFVAGFFTCSVLVAHKRSIAVLAASGTEVNVITSKGERKYTLAANLREGDEYAILTIRMDENTPPITFAVKAEQVTLHNPSV